MFSVFRPSVRAEQRASENAAAAEYVATRAKITSELAAMRLVANGGKNKDAAQLLIILHQLNAESRVVLYRTHVGTAEELAALYNQRPELYEWGTRDSIAQMLPADFWVRFFTVVRLESWITDTQNERVVLKKDFRLLESPAERERLRSHYDTSDFVRFKHGLCRTLFAKNRSRLSPDTSSVFLLRDMVLLYFIHCALMGKNGRDVLNQAHFDYLGDGGRDVTWQYMQDNDAHLERGRSSDDDFEKRVEPPRRSWRALLSMLTFDLQEIYVSCEPEAPPPVPPRTDLEEQPAETGTDTEPQTESTSARIDAPLCHFHDLALEHHDAPCPTKCVTGRVGAQQGAQLHYRSANSRFVDEQKRAGIAPQKAVCAAIGVALMPNAPRARETVLKQLDSNVRITRGAQSTAEWTDLMHSLEHVDAPLAGAEHVQKMAQYCGWAQRTPAEQLQRYVTAYGAPDRQQAFRARGWAVDDRIDHWMQRQPRVPIRVAQTILHTLPQ